MKVYTMFETKDYGYCERSADYESEEGEAREGINKILKLEI